MVRTQVKLTEKQLSALKRIAEEKNITVSDLVRQGIENIIIRESNNSLEEKKQRFLSCSGKFRSAKSDVARRHDHYLAEAYKK